MVFAWQQQAIRTGGCTEGVLLACIHFSVCLRKHQQSCYFKFLSALLHIFFQSDSLALTCTHTLAACDAGP